MVYDCDCFILQDGKKHEVSGNLKVATAISQWVLRESGVLRVKSVAHHKKGENAPPTSYTIMDTVVSFIDSKLIFYCTVVACLVRCDVKIT